MVLSKPVGQVFYRAKHGVPGHSRRTMWGPLLAATLAVIITPISTLGLPPPPVSEPPLVLGANEVDPLQGSMARQRARKSEADRLRYAGEGIAVTSAEIERFLADKHSPLATQATQIVAASNRYEVDPRLIVAISGVESDFGRVCRGFNAWGWNNGRTRWRSWGESIDAFTRAISERYPNWRNVRSMAARYNPNTPHSWSKKVTALMASIAHAPPA